MFIGLGHNHQQNEDSDLLQHSQRSQVTFSNKFKCDCSNVLFLYALRSVKGLTHRFLFSPLFGVFIVPGNLICFIYFMNQTPQKRMKKVEKWKNC